MKIQKELSKQLLAMTKREEIIDQLDSKMRSTNRGKSPLVRFS